MHTRLAVLAVCLGMAPACISIGDGSDPEPTPEVNPEATPDVDAGQILEDAGATDAGRIDVEDDAGATDAGAIDAGVDAGAVDGGATDAGPSDGGPSDGGIAPGDLDVTWIAGAEDCNATSQEPIQVHAYSARTIILRQSKCTNFEGPFLYLLLGDARALLLDTGATQNASVFPVHATVEGLIETHLATWPNAPARDDYELVVAHTHGHNDHVAGDQQFEGEPNTVVIGTGQSAVRNFFGLDAWPDGVVTYDLGGRVLDILPIPGHQGAHIAVYDRNEGLLLTGDSLYPGNLFIQNFGQYRSSIEALTLFAAERPIVWVLGTHVEMTSTAGVDYPYGTTYQPAEHRLELSFGHLVELRDALVQMPNQGNREVHDDFIISP